MTKLLSACLVTLAVAHQQDYPRDVKRRYTLINYGDGSFERAISEFSTESNLKTEGILDDNEHENISDAVARHMSSTLNLETSDSEKEQVRSVQYENIRLHVHNSIQDLTPTMKESLLQAAVWIEDSLRIVRPTQALTMKGNRRCYKAEVPQEHLNKAFPNVDFLLYVTSQNVHCGPGTLGWAVNCLSDQNDRPIAGQLNICTKNWGKGLDDVGYGAAFFTHEVLHALGFSADNLAFFRDGNTSYLTPRTPRDSRGTPPVNSEGYFQPGTSTFEGVVFKNGRVVNPSAPRAVSAGYLITPTTQSVVRNHFGCPTARGAAFEDEGGDGSQGSHLEKRIFGPELMTGVISTRPMVSPVTLAVLEDSGWYLPNFHNVPEVLWGRDELLKPEGVSGCDFSRITRPSLGTRGGSSCPVSGPGNKNLFAHHCQGTGLGGWGCTVDGLSIGMCARSDFSNGCRNRDLFYRTDGSTSSCIEERDSSTPTPGGSAFGSESRCTTASLHYGIGGKATSEPRCYAMRCGVNSAASMKSLGQSTAPPHLLFDRVEIQIGGASPATVTCHSYEEGQQKQVPGMTGTITCPMLRTVCANAPCQNGGGWKHGKCSCQPGFVGQFCESKSSLAARSTIPSSFRYEDSGSTLTVGGYYELPVEPLRREQIHRALNLPATTNNNDGLKYAALAPLPEGLSLNTETGAISGVPVSEVRCTLFPVSATNGSGKYVTTLLELAISSKTPAQPSEHIAARKPCAKVPSPSAAPPPSIPAVDPKPIEASELQERDLAAALAGVVPGVSLSRLLGDAPSVFISTGDDASDSDRFLTLGNPVGLPHVHPFNPVNGMSRFSKAETEITDDVSEDAEKITVDPSDSTGIWTTISQFVASIAAKLGAAN